MSRIISAALRVAAARHRRRRLLILTYHRVLAQPDPLIPDEADAALFTHHMEYLADHFTVLPLPLAVDRLRRGDLPPLAAAITFDDGYASTFQVARPILQRFGLSASFFIATGLLGNGQMFNDTILESIRRCPQTNLDLSSLGLGQHHLTDIAARIRTIRTLIDRLKYLPMGIRTDTANRIADMVGVGSSGRLMMTSDEVLQLHRDGMDVGGHTVTHPILAGQTPEEARSEIQGCFGFLRDLTGGKPLSFAYPNGQPGQDYNRTHVEMVRSAGFDLAVSTALGSASAADDVYELPRVGIWSASSLKLTVNLGLIYLRDRDSSSRNAAPATSEID